MRIIYAICSLYMLIASFAVALGAYQPNRYEITAATIFSSFLFLILAAKD